MPTTLNCASHALQYKQLEQARAESRMILGILPERLSTVQPPTRGHTATEMRQLGIYPVGLLKGKK